MAVNLFFLSDTHFGHGNTITLFKRHDGTPLRDFESAAAMDEHLVERWNSVVKEQDHVYHLGDVAMKRNNLSILSRLNGHLRLIRGNHDTFRTKFYMQYFDEVMACRVFDNIMFTHIPIHPACMGRFSMNVHGHLHHQPAELGETYRNISVEMIDYTPISLEELKSSDVYQRRGKTLPEPSSPSPVVAAKVQPPPMRDPATGT